MKGAQHSLAIRFTPNLQLSLALSPHRSALQLSALETWSQVALESPKRRGLIMARKFALNCVCCLGILALTAANGTTAWGQLGRVLVPAIELGDLNLDGATDGDDFRLLEQVHRGEVSKYSVKFFVLDVNGDGNVNERDSMELQRIIEFVQSGGTFPPLVEAILLGDANGDQRVDLQDVITIASQARGQRIDKFVPRAADVDGNGTVDERDAMALVTQLFAR